MAGKVFWTVRRSKVVSRVQTNIIKTAQVADTPHAGMDTTLLRTLSQCVEGQEQFEWLLQTVESADSAAADEESFGYFQRNLL